MNYVLMKVACYDVENRAVCEKGEIYAEGDITKARLKMWREHKLCVPAAKQPKAFEPTIPRVLPEDDTTVATARAAAKAREASRPKAKPKPKPKAKPKAKAKSPKKGKGE